MELVDYISGEKFQALADVSIIPIGRGNGESECDFVIQQQVNNNYSVFYYDENVTELPEYVQNAKTIFVNTWTLNKFFNKIFPILKKEYTFISHNSDFGINESHKVFLDSPRVVKWYTQNMCTVHPKLYSIPIGLANRQWPHGNTKMLGDIRAANNNKEFLVYKNFDINTNLHERSLCDYITNQNNIPRSNHTTNDHYWNTISRSMFVISPPGNGVDCHRIWECLYLNAIPIVKNNVAFSQFKHLPILWVDSWEEVTIPFLRSKITTINSVDIKELDFKFWSSKING